MPLTLTSLNVLGGNLMGRNLPSATQLAFDQIAELESFYGALGRQDQLILDKLFEFVVQHRATIANASSLLPMNVAILAVLIEMNKKTGNAIDELQGTIQELQERANALRS
jgi:hypothetical protein